MAAIPDDAVREHDLSVGRAHGGDVADLLAESERRFRLLAENASDIVYEVDAAGRVVWVSPSVEEVLGWRPESWIGKVGTDIVAPEDVDEIPARRAKVLGAGQAIDGVEARFLSAAGERRWFSLRAKALHDSSGAVTGAVVGLHDIQSEVTTRRALNALSGANAILVRATEEGDLLSQMCQVAVDRGGYLFAWYGRPQHDDTKSVAAVAWSDEHHGYIDDIEISWDDVPTGQGPTGRAVRTRTTQVVEDFLADEAYAPWRNAAAAHGFRSSISVPVLLDGDVDGVFMVYAPEPNAFDPQAVSALEDLASQLSYGIARLRDGVRLAEALEQQRLLSTAIAQSSEAVVVTDTTPAIRYANPAALRSTGYEAEEVIGQNPRVFKSGLHDAAFYEQLWSRLTGGNTWHGILINRRKNGELYEEDATITPVHDENGERIAYVAVKHDLSRERSLEQAVSRHQLDHESLNSVLRALRPSESLAATAASLCRAMRRFDHVDGAMVILERADGVVVPIAVDGPIPTGQAVGDPLFVEKLDLMLTLSKQGPWWMDLRDPDGLGGADPEFASAMLAEGFVASAYAPIVFENEVVGVLAIATGAADVADWMPSRLGVLVELGAFAGVLLGPQAEQHHRGEAVMRDIHRIIDDEAFHVVFEPVIDLSTGQPVGFEALTRFADGCAPDRRFVDAHSVGLASDLEAACARAALRAASELPEGCWLSLNFSPAAVIDGTAAAVIGGSTRPVVVEITEHNRIENYAAVRRGVAQCGPNVRLAVDDAGAGFASLRHILELDPDFIKLDLGLVRNIDTDPARQALTAGLRHFAALTGTTLIAEGVETKDEAVAVRALGVGFAQGYLFHPPAG